MKILIGMPCGENIPVETVRCLLEIKKTHEISVMLFPGSLVYTARNKIALAAVENRFDYLMFIDSDMTFRPDAIERLLEHDKDIVSGICFKRKPPYSPCIYSKIETKADGNAPIADVVMDYEEGLIEIAGCGAALLLIKVEVLETLIKDHMQLFEPLEGLGEDLSFCYRATQSKYKIFCDTTVGAGHIGKIVITEATYKAFNGERYED